MKESVFWRYVFLTIFLVLASAVPASAWWDLNWSQKQCSLFPNGPRPYQMPVTLSNSSGTSSATTIYLAGHANPDFSDARFLANDSTELQYWIENATTGKFWVNVTTNVSIVCTYYGNVNATSNSNGYAAFPWFDNGDSLSNFTTTGGAPAVAGSEITLNNVAVTEGIRGNVLFNTNTAYRARERKIGTGASNIGGGYDDGTVADVGASNYNLYIFKQNNAGTVQSRNVATTQSSFILNDDSYHTYDVTRGDTTSATYRKDDIVVATHTTNLPSVALYPQFSVRNTGDSEVIDWALIRNYTSPEPAWGGWNDVVLVSPGDGSTVAATYPPLTSSVTFQWTSTYSDHNLQVAYDVNFNQLVVDTTITGFSSTQSLESGHLYYWRVRGYNATSGVYGGFSSPNSFTLSSSVSSGGLTGIQGVVYEILAGQRTPVSGATVFIYNTSWSNTQIVGSNGYYLFNNLANSSVYFIKATKKNYVDSNLQTVNTTAGALVTQNIPLERCVSSLNCVYNQIYEKIIVQDIWFTKYPNVLINIYQSGEANPSFTLTTDAQGSAKAFMIKDQLYRITAVNTTLGINYDANIYPSDSGIIYLIVSTSTGNFYTSGSDKAQQINISISTNMLNSSYAYINTSYVDGLAQTSGLTFYLNQSIAGDPNNQTNLQTISGGSNSSFNASFLVNQYSGNSYLVNIQLTHATFGAQYFGYGVQFPAKPSALGNFDATVLLMLGVGFVLFIAGMFGQTTATQGSGIVVGVVWILYGALNVLTIANVGAGFVLAMVLATILAVVANITERQRREGIS